MLRLQRADQLDAAAIHGDGTTTAAKKGGDNIGFNGHKKDKVVACYDWKCNEIAPFISAAGNQNKSPLLREALPAVMQVADSIELDLRGTIVSLDGVYECHQPQSQSDRGGGPFFGHGPGATGEHRALRAGMINCYGG